jgi:uncharacterized protein (DUF305 family)
MRTYLLAATASLTIAASSLAHAQNPAEHEQHHPGGSSTTTQSAPAQPAPAQPALPSQPQAQSPAQPQAQMPMGQMMQGMPEQCRAMMQNMPESCRGMMQQMMQGGMMRQGGGTMQSAPAQSASQSEATKAYLASLDKMHRPMMEGVQASDADVAFVRGMIAHHQGAIDMARVRLQYGHDEQTKKWAEDIIRDQHREIAEMQAWLQKNAK